MRTDINYSVFPIFLRYLINAAQNKRLVPYHELENIFGFSHNMVGIYAGALGDFCLDQGYPLLNTLIVSASNPKPASVYNLWLEERGLGEDYSAPFECFKFFHLTSSREKQVKNFSGMTKLAREWMDEQANYLIAKKIS